MEVAAAAIDHAPKNRLPVSREGPLHRISSNTLMRIREPVNGRAMNGDHVTQSAVKDQEAVRLLIDDPKKLWSEIQDIGNEQVPEKALHRRHVLLDAAVRGRRAKNAHLALELLALAPQHRVASPQHEHEIASRILDAADPGRSETRKTSELLKALAIANWRIRDAGRRMQHRSELLAKIASHASGPHTAESLRILARTPHDASDSATSAQAAHLRRIDKLASKSLPDNKSAAVRAAVGHGSEFIASADARGQFRAEMLQRLTPVQRTGFAEAMDAEAGRSYIPVPEQGIMLIRSSSRSPHESVPPWWREA